ncbi:MAG: DUF72 domain-containing protein [Desulfobulbaceae bacterium]|nr:MAG: DUF72 domain-containing protein [Desulfobulbaceae bacterium]
MTDRRGLDWVEIRNPNWLRGGYFDFLAAHDLGHVFLQGYYISPIFGVYWQFRDKLASPVVILMIGRPTAISLIMARYQVLLMAPAQYRFEIPRIS